MTNITEIAERIEAARIKAGMTRDTLAVAANIPERTLRRRMSNPAGFSLAELIAINRVLNVPLEVTVSDSAGSAA